MSDFESNDSWSVIGLASTALLHELGNHLNRIGLQAFLVQRKVDAALKSDLQVIRDDCKAAAQLMQPIHEQCQDRQSSLGAVELPASLQLSPSVKINADPETVRILFSLLQRALANAEMPPLTSIDAGYVRIRYTIDQTSSSSSEELWEEIGPFQRLSTLERWALQRAMRETAAKCTVMHIEQQVYFEVEWSIL